MATFLVTQATGSQGRETVAHLLEAGVKVHALVRDAHKIPPILKSPGVTLFQGESKNLDDVLQAAQGCKGAYLNTFPYPGLEILQAQTIIEACKKAGVERIVACTTVGVGNRPAWDTSATAALHLIDYFSSKAEVEAAVRAAGFASYTILRPAILLQDLLLPGVHQNYPRLHTHGELDHAFDDGVRAAQTDAFDVGRYAAAALLDPAKFNGQEIELVSEALTAEEMRDVIVRVSGRDVGLKKRSPEEVEEAKRTVFGQSFQLLTNTIDIWSKETAREVEAKYGIPLTSVEAGLQREKARLLECLPAA
ncbi:NmrA family protein [Microdochium trichocladiopsis]|uniref:NmrA family protein n=1 Tax=Microdochium trichocladiopsis TaxID=1682393 RepID=A0A9P8XWL7_9PEZI|nr:NmrA family protein [Microdochium trichocladiopsis]KAH7016431.1 NmrA family protein [Microdochium trichocladiopsis]